MATLEYNGVQWQNQRLSRGRGPKRPECLMSGVLQKKFAEPSSRVKRLSARVASRGEARALLCLGLTWSWGLSCINGGWNQARFGADKMLSPGYSFLSPEKGQVASRAQSVWVVG